MDEVWYLGWVGRMQREVLDCTGFRRGWKSTAIFNCVDIFLLNWRSFGELLLI